MNTPRIVSAFPGTGKTHYCNVDISQYDYTKHGWAIDSDSSKFNKDHFPKNYIDHIKEEMNKEHAIIFVSSHKDVRDALVANGLFFTLVYPDISLKYEYLKRYKERGSPEPFISLLERNFDNWIWELMQQEQCEHIVLKSNQFISNIM